MNTKFAWLISSCPVNKIKYNTKNIFDKLSLLKEYKNMSIDDIIVMAEEKVNQYYDDQTLNKQISIASYFYVKIFVIENELGQLIVLDEINDTLKKFKTVVKFMFNNILREEEFNNLMSGKSRENLAEDKQNVLQDNRLIKINDTVIINSGGLKNFQGVFVKNKNNSHAIVYCNIFGKNNVIVNINKDRFVCGKKK